MRWLVGVTALAVAVACAPAAALTPVPAFSPPARPEGEVVLTVATPAGSVAWDVAALAALETTEVTVFEPFLERDTSFTVVPFVEVLGRSGLTRDDRVHLVALDAYTVDLAMAELRDGGVWLALAREGRPIGLPDGGPIRVVFDETAPAGRNQDHWIWSLSQVAVPS